MREFIKCLNYCLLSQWRVLLSPVLGLVLCSNVLACDLVDGILKNCDAKTITRTTYNCTSALSAVQNKIDYYGLLFQDAGCINIKIEPPTCVNNIREIITGEGCAFYASQITGEVNPESPGSCRTYLSPENGMVTYHNFSDACQLVDLQVECPAMANLPPNTSFPTWNPESGLIPWTFCKCADGLIAGTGDNWESCISVNTPWVSPCAAPREACITHCGSAENVLHNQCILDSNNESVLMPPVCACINPPPPLDCDFETGEGCATSDKQDEQLTAMQRIEREIMRGTLHYSGVEGVLRKNDGTFTDIKTLLTQIAAAPGVVSPGGGTAGTGGGTGGGETENPVFSVPETVKGFADADLEVKSKIELKNQELKNTIHAIKSQFLEKFNSSTGVGSLPCWRDLPLFQGRTFDICFSDSEEQLEFIPDLLYAIAVILAGFFLFSRYGK